MDTYTKQVDCPEIQGLWEPKIGDRSNNGILKEIEILEANSFNSPLKATVTKKSIWLPRQEDWQNILFRKYYAPAVPTKKKIWAATIFMFQEHVDYMRGQQVSQPCEAWARMLMDRHGKRWTEEGWA